MSRERNGGVPGGLTGQPVLLGQAHAPREVAVFDAFVENRRKLFLLRDAVEDALESCAAEDKALVEDQLVWIDATLAATGPAFARALVKAAPAIREGYEVGFESLARASE